MECAILHENGVRRRLRGELDSGDEGDHGGGEGEGPAEVAEGGYGSGVWRMRSRSRTPWALQPMQDQLSSTYNPPHHFVSRHLQAPLLTTCQLHRRETARPPTLTTLSSMADALLRYYPTIITTLYLLHIHVNLNMITAHWASQPRPW